MPTQVVQPDSIAGQEAVDLGLATCLEDDPLEAAIALGRRYAAMDPQLARDIKSSVRTAVRDGFEATPAVEAWAQASSATKPAIHEAMERFRQEEPAAAGSVQSCVVRVSPQ